MVHQELAALLAGSVCNLPVVRLALRLKVAFKFRYLLRLINMGGGGSDSLRNL